MDDKAVKAAMRRMGIRSEDIPASEVIIRSAGKDIVISSPSVTKVNMMGQDTFQVVGNVVERSSVSEDDVQLVSSQAGVTGDVARKALDASGGDIAAAIISLKDRKNDSD
ncbi:nascent polypeptide-associated complex protein [Candidatus Woesearchaeota archaeon]|nr:nascent polypeptide-associated complex protein [Candidatus Woesearchaeota archaeon]